MYREGYDYEEKSDAGHGIHTDVFRFVRMPVLKKKKKEKEENKEIYESNNCQ